MLLQVTEKDGTLIASIEVGAADKDVLTIWNDCIINDDYVVLVDGEEI